MEDPSEEWKIQEYYPDENRGNLMSWIWNKGLGLGKKILVTGVVICSAPLVLPPILVISTIGLVVSVPYGLFVASYACTEKLMSKLLPMPASHPLLEYTTIYGDDENEEFEGKFDLQEGEEELIEDAEEENGYREDVGEFLDGADKWSKSIEVKVEEVRQDDKLDNPVTGERKDVDEMSGIVVGLEGDEKLGIKEGEQLMGETGGLTKEIGDQPEAKNDEVEETPIKKTIVLVQYKNGKVEEREKLVRDSKGLIEKTDQAGVIPIEVKSVFIESKASNDEEEEGLVRGSTGWIEKMRDEGEKHYEEKTQGETEDVKQYGVQKDTKRYGAPEENELVSSHAGHKVADSKKSSALAGVDEHKQISNGRPVTIPSDKVIDSEEKIWGQLDAMRKIVGYKAERHATYVEELRALYLFTGVELPASFMDASDIEQVNDKLHFLMSIVGVK